MVLAKDLRGLTPKQVADAKREFHAQVRAAEREMRLQVLNPGLADPKRPGSQRHQHDYIQVDQMTTETDVPVYHLECDLKCCEGSFLMFERGPEEQQSFR